MNKDRNQPLSGNVMPRFGGPGTLFRLPARVSAADLDIALVGVPLDIGTSNRSGSRFGPRDIRKESELVRPFLMATGAAPFDSFQIAYLSFDIDGLDPSVAPGTGTPEPAGLTGSQALEIIRGLSGTNLVGADLVEVAPPYDLSGNTSLLAANLVFEMLCSFPGCTK